MRATEVGLVCEAASNTFRGSGHVALAEDAGGGEGVFWYRTKASYQCLLAWQQYCFWLAVHLNSCK